MKTSLRILWFVVLLLPVLGMATILTKPAYSKEKHYNKTFDVSKTTDIIIDNRYGNVHVSTWDKSSVSFDIVIKVDGNSQSKVEDKLDGIEIEFSTTSAMVRAITHIENTSSGFSLFNWSSSNLNFQINYEVKVPKENYLTLSNKYGDVFIDELVAPFTLNLKYGSSTIGTLSNRRSRLELDYCTKVKIENATDLDIEADYSNITIQSANNIKINSDYSDVLLTKVDSVSYDFDYGSLEIDRANSIEGNSDYTDIEINQLIESGHLTADYGKLKIRDLKPGFSVLETDSDYVNVQVGFDMASAFSFEINAKYAGIEGKEYVTSTISKEKNNSTYIEGYYHHPSSESKLSITAEYGKITLKKN